MPAVSTMNESIAMGKKYRLQCPECTYEAWSGCRLDIGNELIVSPFVCRSCNILSDVAIGSFGKIAHHTQTEMGNPPFYTCTDCGGNDIVHWDVQKMPCPKCGHAMRKFDGPGNEVEWY